MYLFVNSETRYNWNKKYALKKRISLILKSPRIAFWRICGKPVQAMYMRFLKNEKEADGLEAILNDVVSTYEKDIEHVAPLMKMSNHERKTKLKNLHNYAEGRF